ncbi:TlpA family protein disulfide reductase [Haloplanus rubicundus]|uniref:TlpA family protein disulfide reductase n=1 Tax=Haloplanus rubicundus TaxID=1547898 RepID=A0A345DZH1_9EURY|nr:TlpA disulfide reductase family protein [Haloplanus rubicundus]AXG05343.1 TlpA family protein disulfide reductase [Haloplanus rubicundus]AXG08699.1 TlpA family protein disulfide reductase [Haloplanus rubicundus]
MPSRQRRLFLRAIGTAMSVGIGGCAGRSTGSAADDAAPTTAADDPLTLPSAVTTGDLPDGRVRLVAPGTVTLLNFFTTWCRPCQREMSEFRRLRAEYDADALHMVSITPEVEETLVEEFWAEYEGTWPVVMDPALTATERWNANRYPTNLLFDADGTPAGDGPKVRARTFEEFDALIEPLVAEA